MSPTCSKRDFAGRNALSATDLTNYLSSVKDYAIGRLSATHDAEIGAARSRSRSRPAQV